MNNQILLLLTFCALFFLSCEKEDPFDPTTEPLPPATTSGAHTFGFLLNGKTWLPHFADKSKNPLIVSMDKDSVFMFSINLVNPSINRDESIKIFLQCNAPGPCVPIGFSYVDSYKRLGCEVYDLKMHNLQFEITRIDFSAQIISGQFQSLGAKDSCGEETIDITNGVFDCKFTK